MTFPSSIETFVWSPCSKFIAVVWGRSRATIEILDAVTLGRHIVLDFPLGGTRWFIFSSDSRLLTWFGNDPWKFISWDLQTGILVSAISPEQQARTLDCFSATYSACGTMFGVSFRNDHNVIISTYNARSGTHIYSHSIAGPVLDDIWTHNKRLQFAMTKPGSITVWELGFTPTDAPKEVTSLSVPYESHRPGRHLLHPSLSQLAFIAGRRVKVWGIRHPKFLLDSADVQWPRRMSFSHDGRFFACGTSGPEFYLWKKSSSGYTLHQKFVSNNRTAKPFISPNGESIIAFDDTVIQLWRTTESTTPTQVPQRSEKSFVMGFSPPDEALAAFARMGDETVTVLDLKSGTPRLVIDTNTKVYGLGVGGGTVVVVGEGRIVGWNIPARDIDVRANVDDSVWITTFDHPPFPTFSPRPTTSVSPDLHRVAIVEGRGHTGSRLHVYDVYTGRCLASMPIRLETSPWFTPDGQEVWCVSDSGEAELWGIAEGNEPGVVELEHLESTMRPPDGFPWKPPHGYGVTGGRWVLSSSGKRQLWLPPHWRSDGWNWMWGGRFLALLDRELPEPVILELKE